MKRTLVIVAIVFLALMAANMPLAVFCYTPQRLNFGRPVKLDQGAKAAGHAWPDATPHAQPWPAMIEWQTVAAFGHRRITAHANGFQMQTDLYGWPLPVLIETNRWWPWDDPAWKIGTPPELALRITWGGFLLNPLLAALTLWLLLIAPFTLSRALKRRRRLRRSQCPACGYPMGVSERCTECGVILPARPAASPAGLGQV